MQYIELNISCSHNANVHEPEIKLKYIQKVILLSFCKFYIIISLCCASSMYSTWWFLGAFDLTHSIPLSADVLAREVGVRIDSGQLDAIGLGNLQDLVVDAQGGHALFVGLRQSGLELIMSCDQTL